MEESLQQIGLKFGSDKATWHGYLPFYEQHLPGRDFSGRLLEIGIWEGASLKMWKEYYPKAEIIGIDILVRPESIKRVVMIEMDATDTEALKTLGSFDIIVDDASHITSHQQIAFNHLFPNQLNAGGFYVMEDAQTSFHKQFIDTPVTTYDLLKKIDGHIEFNRDNNESISIIVPKT